MTNSMRGIRREWKYPVLNLGEKVALSDEEKAEVIAKAFIEIHSSDNLTEEGKRGRELTQSDYSGRFERQKEINNTMDAPLTMKK